MHPATSEFSLALARPHEFQLNADATVHEVLVSAVGADSGGYADHTVGNKRLVTVT